MIKTKYGVKKINKKFYSEIKIENLDKDMI